MKIKIILCCHAIRPLKMLEFDNFEKVSVLYYSSQQQQTWSNFSKKKIEASIYDCVFITAIQIQREQNQVFFLRNEL